MKTKWETIENFDPASTGFEFNPELSIFGLLTDLLRQFAENCPNPKNPKEFIGAILLDPISYWHLREELRRQAQVQSAEPYILFSEHGRFCGFPCFLQGVEGIGLAMKQCLAPALLRQQAMHRDLGAGGQPDSYAEMELSGEGPAKPIVQTAATKKEDLH